MPEIAVRYCPPQKGRLALPLKAAERLFASPRSLQYALVDEVSLAAFHLREDVMHLLRGAEAIVVHALLLTASAFSGTAPARFVELLNLSMNLHSLEKFGLTENLVTFAVRKPKVGGVSPSLWCQNHSLTLITSLRSILMVMNQTLNEIAAFMELWVFVSPTLFKVFGIPCLSLIDNTKIMLLFELRKQNQNYFALKSNFFHL